MNDPRQQSPRNPQERAAEIARNERQNRSCEKSPKQLGLDIPTNHYR